MNDSLYGRWALDAHCAPAVLRAGASAAEEAAWQVVADVPFEDPDVAKTLCAGCPVLAECAAWGAQIRPQFGVWGGKTSEEWGWFSAAGSPVSDYLPRQFNWHEVESEDEWVS